MRKLVTGLAVCAAIFTGFATTGSSANESQKMLHKMVGKWAGAGQLTYTKEFTFKFKCEIEGKPGIIDRQVDLLGRCWAGPMWGSMGAALRYNPRTKSYVGKFRDGTSTFMIDISGSRNGNGVNLDLRQGHQRGALDMQFKTDDKLKLKIAVVDPASERQRQVVDLDLERKPTRVSKLD